MDIIANSILGDNTDGEDDMIDYTEEQLQENNNKLIKEITFNMSNFIDAYNPHKLIDAYTSSVVNIEEGMPDILILREKLFILLRHYSDLVISFKEKKFFVKKVTDELSLNLLLSYSMFYYLDAIHSKSKSYIGLDFEFTENKIALCQISFFPKRNFKYIFIYDPKILTDYQQELIIKMVFTSDIIKITHGSDSLDIPYIFEELFRLDSEKILKYTQNLVDTRFLCEYVKVVTNYSDKKCSIYDALLYFKAISKKKYNELMKNNDIMGPIQDVQWEIKKMGKAHLKYVVYDVLYLRKFLSSIFSFVEEKNTVLVRQLELIPPLTRFVFYERYEISDILTISKKMTDDINNYIVESIDKTKKNTMINIYNNVIDKVVIPSIELKVTKLLEINHFKKALSILFKRIIYSIITHRYVVYMNKNDRYTDKITYKEMLKQLMDLKLPELALLLEKFYDTTKVLIITFH